MIFNMSIKELLMVLPAALIAISFHELAHGVAAYLLGDDTARMQGRLTMNPLAHLDPIGFLCLVLMGFGWAKPVSVNPYNFKNRKAGMAITALAGPFSNVLLSFIFTLIAMITYSLAPGSAVASAFTDFLLVTASISTGLAIFNLLPVPPLDGSKILYAFLPNHLIAKLTRYEGYLSFAIMALLFLGLLDGILITARSFISGGIYNLCFSLMALFGLM